MRFAAAILASLVLAAAPPPTTCGATDDYSRALCAYQNRHFSEAAAIFRSIAERNEPEPQTIRSLYFLARTEMKLGRYDEASPLFIRIYETDPAFYREWGCDFLLGECRSALGKS
jgi:TolA-binding protein